jgi:Protein of unknown function (DUF3078)
MKQLFVVLMLSAVSLGFAQRIDDKKAQEEAAKGDDTTLAYGWNFASATGINLSQVAYENWASGGQNSLAWGFWFNGGAAQRAEKTRWTNFLKLAYGQTKQQGLGMRKTDDEIYFESLLIYIVGTTVNPYASATFRTQFAPGYNYPTEFTSTQISAFFDPAYLTQSVGVAYTPTSMLTVRAGVGMREVLTNQFNQYADDPNTPEIERSRIQGGMEGIADFKWPFAENMVFLSRLETFFPFQELGRGYARWDNTIAMKVNKIVTVNFNVQIVSDPQVQAKTQLKEALAVGLSYTLL